MMYQSAVLLLLQGCCCISAATEGWKNDATELLPDYTGHPEPQLQTVNNNNNNNNNIISSNSTNDAKNGGKRQDANIPAYDASDLSCRELRSTRYITDGLCRSAKAVKELLCSGQCLPAHLMPNTIHRNKWWRSSPSDYRCIPAHSRLQRIQLHCPNGNSRTYKTRVVTSCKCKRLSRHHNQSDAKEKPSPKTRRNKKATRLQQARGLSRETALSSNTY